MCLLPIIGNLHVCYSVVEYYFVLACVHFFLYVSFYCTTSLITDSKYTYVTY